MFSFQFHEIFQNYYFTELLPSATFIYKVLTENYNELPQLLISCMLQLIKIFCKDLISHTLI